MIKLFLVDVDSTLTDGIYQTDEEGGIRKNFYTRDFHGMYMLDRMGVMVSIITASRDPVIERQCNRCAKYITEILTGARDKFLVVKETFVDRGLFKWDEIAYIGDDVMDLDLLKQVGLSACPFDAAIAVIMQLDISSDGFVMDHKGGHGCVREFAELVMALNLEKENG